MNIPNFLGSIRPLHREILLIGPLVTGFGVLLASTTLWAPSPIDREFTRTIQGWDFGAIPRLGSDIGGGVYGTYLLPSIVGAWFAVTRRWKLLVLLLGVFALHYLLITPKLFVTAYRPSPVFGVQGGGGLESFPSGHVQWAVSFYGLLAYLAMGQTRDNKVRAGIIAAFALVVLGTMLGRIDLGRHWLTDTLGGVIVGLIALRALVHLHRWPALDRVFAKLPGRRRPTVVEPA